MDEEKARIDARFTAITHLLAIALQSIYELKGMRPAEILLEHDSLLAGVRDLTLPHLDPAASDASAQTIEEELQHILRGVEELAGIQRSGD